MIISRVNIHERRQSILVIVIEKENLERMGQGDPITIESVQRGGKAMQGIDYPANLSLLIAYEADEVELYKVARSGDLLALLRYLERNRKWDPATDGILIKL